MFYLCLGPDFPVKQDVWEESDILHHSDGLGVQTKLSIIPKDEDRSTATPVQQSLERRSMAPMSDIQPLQHSFIQLSVITSRLLLILIRHIAQHISNHYLSTINVTVQNPRQEENQYIFHEIFWSAYHSVKTNAITSQSSTVCIDQSLSFVTSFTAVVINLAVLWVSGILR